VSNLDSPIIGLALHMAGLPPFVYGAGLNLFSNPVMGWWMHRLGAYTVDRTKKARLYKQVLTDYSVRSLTHRHHSLFFPGGTRARSGSLEPRLKKGLLGTAVVAWQEMLQAKRADSEVYIVPMTLSFQLVLEAATLIDDHLSEAGKQRYIISDDEFTKPRRLLAFANRVLDLDASVVARFGAPMDCLGNPVPSSAKERREATAHRRRYVTNAEGEVEWDAQRDRVYTDRLSKRIVEAYPRSAELMATHLAANAAWSLLEERLGSHDLFRLVRCPIEKRRFARWELIARLRQHLGIVGEGVAAGQWHHQSGQRAAEILAVALDRFGRYHRSRALHAQGAEVVMQDPKLCLYYRNRAKFIHEET
jgi:glycerol-3-phosphate O-acyltransferase